jgi:hypothetical protein
MKVALYNGEKSKTELKDITSTALSTVPGWQKKFRIPTSYPCFTNDKVTAGGVIKFIPTIDIGTEGKLVFTNSTNAGMLSTVCRPSISGNRLLNGTHCFL